MGMLDFSKFELSIKSWKLVSMSPYPPTLTWECWILANLNSASKVGNWSPQAPPPTLNMGMLDFSKFELRIKSWKLVFSSPSPTLNMGMLDFSKFELSIKSWKLVSMSPYPPTLNMGMLDFSEILTQHQKLEIGFNEPPHPQHGNFGF